MPPTEYIVSAFGWGSGMKRKLKGCPEVARRIFVWSAAAVGGERAGLRLKQLSGGTFTAASPGLADLSTTATFCPKRFLKKKV